MTTPHPVYPGGPPCNPNCPGESSMYHDGYADGYENAEAAGVLLPDQPTEEREYRGIQTEAGKRLFGVVSLDAILAIEYEAAALPAPPPATPGLDVERLTRALGTAEVGCYYRPITHDARIDDSIHYTDAIAIAREYAALAETPGESLGHSEQCQRIGGGPGHDQCICWCHGYER